MTKIFIKLIKQTTKQHQQQKLQPPTIPSYLTNNPSRDIFNYWRSASASQSASQLVSQLLNYNNDL